MLCIYIKVYDSENDEAGVRFVLISVLDHVDQSSFRPFFALHLRLACNKQ